MNVWAIYFNPSDFPNQYVIRRWLSTAEGAKGDDVATAVDTLEEAREVIPPGLARFEPQETDPPILVETWF